MDCACLICCVFPQWLPLRPVHIEFYGSSRMNKRGQYCVCTRVCVKTTETCFCSQVFSPLEEPGKSIGILRAFLYVGSFPSCPQQSRLGRVKSETPPWSLTWAVGLQVLEPSTTAFQAGVPGPVSGMWMSQATTRSARPQCPSVFYLLDASGQLLLSTVWISFVFLYPYVCYLLSCCFFFLCTWKTISIHTQLILFQDFWKQIYLLLPSTLYNTCFSLFYAILTECYRLCNLW